MTSLDAAQSLAGKVALVTGAGRGLGRAFAERLASLGADVAIHGTRENGPAEYGEGSTLTAVAETVAAEHGVRTIRVLGDLTKGADRFDRRVQGPHQRVDLCRVESWRHALYTLSRRSIAAL